jgi:hypothetical protein
MICFSEGQEHFLWVATGTVTEVLQASNLR